jgi:serine/threonine protein kinase
MLIYLITFKYHKNNFFHGDIKPSNIFFIEGGLFMTTDIGSLLNLGDETDHDTKFIGTCYSDVYASP